MGKLHLDQELRSLGIEPDHANELNDENELDSLLDNLKLNLFIEYKAAYSEKNQD